MELVAFFVRSVIKFFYVRYAESAGEKISFACWDRGECPVCGQKPRMAMLREEDGARILECGLCHTRWKFFRLACPECGNRDQESLGYFYVPRKESRRVYICNCCRSYLKTTVLKGLGREILPDLENIATFYLDHLARKEGYNIVGSAENYGKH